MKVERQRRLERIKQKQSQLQELILQVRGFCPGGHLVVRAPRACDVASIWFWACFPWLAAPWAATLTSQRTSLLGVGWGRAGPSHMPRAGLAVRWPRVSVCANCASFLANRLQEPGAEEPPGGAAGQPAAPAQLCHPPAFHHREHQQEDGHRLQHLQRQVGHGGGACRRGGEGPALCSAACLRGRQARLPGFPPLAGSPPPPPPHPPRLCGPLEGRAVGSVRTAVRTAGGTWGPSQGRRCLSWVGRMPGKVWGLGVPSQASAPFWRRCFSDGDHRLQV